MRVFCPLMNIFLAIIPVTGLENCLRMLTSQNQGAYKHPIVSLVKLVNGTQNVWTSTWPENLDQKPVL